MSAGTPSTARTITSLQNDRVKAIRALDMRKERKETGLFVAEGLSILMTAREAGFVPETLVYRAGATEAPAISAFVDWALASRVEVLEVSTGVLEKLAAKENPQTLLAVYRQRYAEAPVPKKVEPKSTWVALEEIRDPGNLGTIIRTSDAAGASGVILVGTTCDPWSRDCVRATMGSIFNVPLVKLSREDFLALLKRWPGDTIGTHIAATDDFRKVAFKGPTLVVMGSEGPGLTDEVARACSRLVKIPMSGPLDSLNLAVATALTLYEVRRGLIG